jgi:hypothetical protein
MHRTTLEIAPGVDRMTLGFFQHDRNGHTGDRPRRRHGLVPQRDEPVPGRRRGPVRVAEQPRRRRTDGVDSATRCSRASRTATSLANALTFDRRRQDRRRPRQALIWSASYFSSRGRCRASTPLKLINLVTGQLTITTNHRTVRSPPPTCRTPAAPRSNGARCVPSSGRTSTASDTLGAKIENGKVVHARPSVKTRRAMSWLPIPFAQVGLALSFRAWSSAWSPCC